MAIVYGDLNNFKELVNDDLVLVDFYAQWCGPCKMLGPVLEQMDTERSLVKIVKVNIDDNSELTQTYGVMSVPTLILFKNGEVLDIKNGYMPKDLLDNWISKYL
ncbi:MAG: thioredoxin [Bacilli bacterium]